LKQLDECFEQNDHLRANGHLVAEVPLQPPETAFKGERAAATKEHGTLRAS